MVGGGFLCLCVCKAKRKSLLTGLTSTVELTSHRVYQELVYRNEVLKTMLARSNYPSLSSSPAVFAQLLSMRFPDYLGTVYVKRKKVRFSSHFRHLSSLDDCVGFKATFRKQQTTQLWMRGVRKGSRLFCFP